METLVNHAEFSDDLKTRVAWLYHMEGMTQDDIAKVLDLSRSRVLRILANSRKSGLVQIRVTSKFSYCVQLERLLESKYKLESAIVVPKPQNTEMTNEIIGAVLGGYVSEAITENMTVGLGWGNTLSASLPHIKYREQAGVNVISLLGGLTRVSGSNPSEFAWRLADRVSAACYMMAAPVYAPDPLTREALLGHPGIMEIFNRARKLDLAVLSVGDLSPFSTVSKYFLLGRDDFSTLQAAGAVGDVLCRFIDAEGNVLEHPVNDRVIAVSPKDLSSARKLVLASGGWQKYDVIRGALRLLKPHVLITDELVAERLVSETG